MTRECIKGLSFRVKQKHVCCLYVDHVGGVSLRSPSFHRLCQMNEIQPAMLVRYLKAKRWKE